MPTIWKESLLPGVQFDARGNRFTITGADIRAAAAEHEGDARP